MTFLGTRLAKSTMFSGDPNEGQSNCLDRCQKPAHTQNGGFENDLECRIIEFDGGPSNSLWPLIR